MLGMIWFPLESFIDGDIEANIASMNLYFGKRKHLFAWLEYVR